MANPVGPFKVVEVPAQKRVFPEISTKGKAFATKVRVAVAVQPKASVTVKVKVPLVFKTKSAVPVCPLDQAYCVNPIGADQSAESPAHTLAGPLMEATGAGGTVAFAEVVPVQPLALVTVTV